MKSSSKKIKEAADIIAKKYKPEKVILFGSYAWGKPTKDSDIDLFIIKETRKNPYKRVPEARAYLYGVDSAFDIIVMTPKEIERKKEKNFFLNDILSRGKILYELPQ